MNNALIRFCCSCKSIFIYGAGMYGKMYKMYLEKYGICVEGFIVTKCDDFNRTFCELPVITWDEYCSLGAPDNGIVLAMTDYNTKEVLSYIRPVDKFFFTSEDSFLTLYNAGIKERLFKIYDSISFPSAKPSSAWHNILVIQIERTFGDLVWSSAFFRELRKNYNNSHITLVISAHMADLMSDCPYIDELLLYELDFHFRLYDEKLERRVAEFCRKKFGTYDVVFLPRVIPRKGYDRWENVLMMLYSGAPVRIGHADYLLPEDKKAVEYFEGLYSVVVKHTEALHEVERNLSLLKDVGGKVNNVRMELWTNEESEIWANRFLASHGVTKGDTIISVGLVGSAGYKSWPASNYRAICENIKMKYKKKVKFLLLGSGQDASDAAQSVLKNFDGGCINLVNLTTLKQVISVIKKCHFYVGSDTGLLHVAASMGKPIIQIISTSQDAPIIDARAPVRIGAWQVPSATFRPKSGSDDCRFFCHKKVAHCIKKVKWQDVLEAVHKFINLYGKMFET